MALKLLFLNILMSTHLFANECSVNPAINKKKVTYERKVEQEIIDFSQQKSIQTEAELILSKLIQTKSSILLHWIKERNLNPEKEPDILATEWFKYYAKMFVINAYPKNKDDVNKATEILFQKLVHQNFNKEVKRKIDKIFKEAKASSIKKINSYPISDADKKLLIERINDIKIYIPEELKDSKYKLHPLEFFDWSLAFDPKNNEINLGLKSPLYDFSNLKTALMHEIAHSFDSCRWSTQNQTPWPFEKIGNCLRSIALKRDDSKLDELLKIGKLTETDANFFKQNPTCNNSTYPPIGTQSDQLPETFADWFSAEAIEEIDVTKDIRTELCLPSKLNPGSSYLSNADRLNKIYFSNAKIHKKLKLKNQETYCKF